MHKTHLARDYLYIFLIALLIRCAVLFIFSNEPPTTDTLGAYQPIAQSIINGDGYSRKGILTATKAPLFVLFLVLMQKFFGVGFFASRIAFIFIDSLMCILVYQLAKLLGDRKTALSAGILTGLYPPLIWFSSVKIGSETIFTFFLVLCCLLLVYASIHNKSYFFAGAGCVLGLAALTRSAALFLPFFVCLYFFLKSGTKKRNMNLFLFLLFFLLILSPWPVRNYMVFNRIFAGESRDTASIYVGSQSDFLTNTHQRRIFSNQRLKALSFNKNQVKDEFESRALYYKAAISNYIEQWDRNPLSLLKLYLKKFVMLWYYTESRRWDILMALLNFSILPFSVYGFFVLRSKFNCREALLLSFFVIYFIIGCTIMFPLVRYMVPVMPFLLIFAPFSFRRR